MQTYTIEFNGSRETIDGRFSSDTDAKAWVESVLANTGHNPDDLVAGDWDQAGFTPDDKQRWRMLYWESEEEADNDAGANAICQLCKVEE